MYFALLEIAIGIDKRRLAQAQRLNLCSDKYHTCDILLQYLVVKGCSLIADVYIFIICHISSILHKTISPKLILVGTGFASIEVGDPVKGN